MPYTDYSKVRRLSVRKGGRMFLLYRDGREQEVPVEDQDRVVEELERHRQRETLRFLKGFEVGG